MQGGRELKPINFGTSNTLLTKPNSMTDAECKSLSVFTDGEQCVSCWKPSFRERLSILFYGRIWLSVLSGSTQPPVRIKGTKNVKDA
jgi:hypothetical protein